VYPKWLRWTAIGGLATALLAGRLLINNEYIRLHRTIHVVNATGQPVRARVENQPPVTIGDFGRLVVNEGWHRIQLSGPVAETHEVEHRAGFFDRWSSKPNWILDPGGEAVLEQGLLFYAENPPPSTHHLIVGRSFVTLPHVDYAFEAPPDKLDIKRKGGQVEKTSRLVIGPESQALICAVLAERFPARRAEYHAAAARYNVRRRPPYQLVARALERSAIAARLGRVGIPIS
jgi:hypothetical protein